MLRSFFIALSFLTIIPSPKIADWQDDDFAKSARAYPLVGLLIGLILLLMAYSLANVDAFLRAAILIAIWYLITGGLHFDGLSDTADAVFASKNPTERQIIAKDPRIGSFALLTAILVVVLKIATIASFKNFWIIFFTPIISRTLILEIMALFPLQSNSKIAKMFKLNLAQVNPVFLATAAILMLVALLLKIYLLILALLLTSIFSFLLAFWINQRMQGLNGDSYGTIIELSELCLLLVFALLY